MASMSREEAYATFRQKLSSKFWAKFKDIHGSAYLNTLLSGFVVLDAGANAIVYMQGYHETWVAKTVSVYQPMIEELSRVRRLSAKVVALQHPATPTQQVTLRALCSELPDFLKQLFARREDEFDLSAWIPISRLRVLVNDKELDRLQIVTGHPYPVLLNPTRYLFLPLEELLQLPDPGDNPEFTVAFGKFRDFWQQYSELPRYFDPRRRKRMIEEAAHEAIRVCQERVYRRVDMFELANAMLPSEVSGEERVTALVRSTGLTEDEIRDLLQPAAAAASAMEEEVKASDAADGTRGLDEDVEEKDTMQTMRRYGRCARKPK